MLEITDMELIQMLRCCGKAEESADCGHCPAADYGCAGAFLRVADRLEKLMAENEALKTKLWPEYCQDMAEYSCPRVARLRQEIDHLREVTKIIGEDTNVPTKWHLGTEYPPMEKIEDPEDEWWESDRAVVVTSKGVLTVATAWELNGEFGWTDEVEQKDVAVKMWMQLEPPSTEGVE